MKKIIISGKRNIDGLTNKKKKKKKKGNRKYS